VARAGGRSTCAWVITDDDDDARLSLDGDTGAPVTVESEGREEPIRLYRGALRVRAPRRNNKPAVSSNKRRNDAKQK